MEIVTDQNKFLKWTSKHRFKNFKILSPEVVAVFLAKSQVKLCQAYGVGFTILERAKAFVFEQYYTKILPSIGPHVELLMTDTDCE